MSCNLSISIVLHFHSCKNMHSWHLSTWGSPLSRLQLKFGMVLKKTLLRSEADCCLKLLMSSKGILNISGHNGIRDFKAIMHVQVASKRIKSESVADSGMLVPVYSNLFNEPVQMTIQVVSCSPKHFISFPQAPAHVSIKTFCKHD